MNKCDSLQEARDDFKKECDSLDIRSGSPLSGTQQPSISPEPPYNIKPVLYIFYKSYKFCFNGSEYFYEKSYVSSYFYNIFRKFFKIF